MNKNIVLLFLMTTSPHLAGMDQSSATATATCTTPEKDKKQSLYDFLKAFTREENEETGSVRIIHATAVDTTENQEAQAQLHDEQEQEMEDGMMQVCLYQDSIYGPLLIQVKDHLRRKPLLPIFNMMVEKLVQEGEKPEQERTIHLNKQDSTELLQVLEKENSKGKLSLSAKKTVSLGNLLHPECSFRIKALAGPRSKNYSDPVVPSGLRISTTPVTNTTTAETTERLITDEPGIGAPLETETVECATADHADEDNSLTREELAANFLAQLKEIHNYEQLVQTLRKEMETVLKKCKSPQLRSIKDNKIFCALAVEYASFALDIAGKFMRHIDVIHNYLLAHNIDTLVKSGENEITLVQETAKRINFTLWLKHYNYYQYLLGDFLSKTKDAIEMEAQCYKEPAENQNSNLVRIETVQTIPAEDTTKKTTSATIVQQKIPYLTTKPLSGFFAWVCNFFWPQLPELEIKTEQATTIDANQSPKALIDHAANTAKLSASFNNDRLTQALAEKKNSSAQALKLTLCARTTKMSTAIDNFQPATMLANISKVRGWSCGIIASTAVGLLSHQFFTNHHTLHPKTLALGSAIASYYLLKPIYRSLMQRLLEKFAHAQIAQNEQTREHYLNTLADTGLHNHVNVNTIHQVPHTPSPELENSSH